MRAAGAANRVRVRQLLHDSLNVFDSHSTDHRPTFVAKDIRLAFAYADGQAAAAFNLGNVLMRNNRQLIKFQGTDHTIPW